MSATSKSGIQTGDDGSAFIPSSKRADGSTRKQIRVRPGYRPPEDIETYKNRSAEAWKNRDKGGIPGADPEINSVENEPKNKNAKRREAARRKTAPEANDDIQLSAALSSTSIQQGDMSKQDVRNSHSLLTTESPQTEADVELQKKTRNALKKLRAVRELKAKKTSGEKLSPDQLLKVGKEDELVRDLKKLGYEGPGLTDGEVSGHVEGSEEAKKSG